MLKQPNFFYRQPSTLAKFYLSTTFRFSFMTSSGAPTRSSTFYAYLITKIGKRNLELVWTEGHFPQMVYAKHLLWFSQSS